MIEVGDTGGKRVAESFESMVIKESERVKPIIRKQFLKEFIFGLGDTQEIFDIFCTTFGVSKRLSIRMAVIKPAHGTSYEDMFFLENAIIRCIGEKKLLLLTSMREQMLLITTVTDRKELTDALGKVCSIMRSCYGWAMTVIYSMVCRLEEAPNTYERLIDHMAYDFYSDETDMICEDKFSHINKVELIEPCYGEIEKAVKSGNRGEARNLLQEFFEKLEKAMPTPALAKTYCLELYVCIIRCCEVEKIDKYMKGIVAIQEHKTLSGIKEFISEKADEIVEANIPKNIRIYSSLIKETIRVIEENIGNENLSLRWLAGTILYTNVDYLGKLFKKEIGKNFSHYVMEKRMEMAKKLIVDGKKDRIYEVAEKVGYGSNSQYFSQVFKKYTGVSPLEYKEFARNNKMAVAN